MNREVQVDDSLLTRFLAGETSPEEAMLVSSWLEESDDNRKLFEKYEVAWALEQRHAYHQPDKSVVFEGIKEKISSQPKAKTIYFTPLRLAAAVLIIMGASALVYLSIDNSLAPSEKWMTKKTEESTANIALIEGSTVVLNRSSQLSYPEKFAASTRSVKLTGEAFFDVAHDPSNPFVIELEEIEVKVLGTSFNVLAIPGSALIEVQVVKGKVRMQHGSDALIIEAGQKGLYEKATKKMWIDTPETENNLGYATHTFVFEDTSFKKALEDISTAFGVTFVLEKEQVNECYLTSSYEGKPLPVILEIMTKSLDLTYQVKGNIVYISGDGCL
jgi:transmembrane sensor